MGITFNSTPESNGLYVGSDGNYYAKCAENASEISSKSKYTDGTQPGTNSSTFRYFKVEPIKWKVLTDNYSGKKLLLAENILTANVPYYTEAHTRTVGSDTAIFPNNYKYSQIRAYLNGLTYYDNLNTAVDTYSGKRFLQTAFTRSAQKLIAVTTVDNRKETTGYDESTYADFYASEDTADKIFLLSTSVSINSEYGFGSYNTLDSKRIRFLTDYAKANYALQSSTTTSNGYWMLRSPYDSHFGRMRVINYNGTADSIGDLSTANGGIVPALSISF